MENNQNEKEEYDNTSPIHNENYIKETQAQTSENLQDITTTKDEHKENLFSDASSSKSKSPSIRSGSRSDSRNSSKRSEQRNSLKMQHRSRSNSSRSNQSKDFRMKNGCCRECMRAFSRTGKSCLCQVPKNERKYSLPDKGCNFCGCHGCNPADVRRDQRIDLKRQYKDDKSLQYKNQRLLDSDDEELKINVK